MINKYTIDTMMNKQIQHSFISTPVQAMSAYWVEITRGDSNLCLGYYRI
jgi:hypothetical protein